jgi:dipeptidyl aminopeptidase/acylaminoacyl peptidase
MVRRRGNRRDLQRRVSFFYELGLAGLIGLASLLTCARATERDAVTAINGPTKRPLEIRDLFNLESVGEFFGPPAAFAPDGVAVAFTRIRAVNTMRDVHRGELNRNDAGDIWIKIDHDAPVRNLTGGISDGTGWWAPSWSPDGERLAMLSTRAVSPAEATNIWLWIWDRKTDHMFRASDRPIDAKAFHSSLKWLDASHIVCPLLPKGEVATSIETDDTTRLVASRAWARASAGQETTASVLESGQAVPTAAASRRQLGIVDVRTRAAALLGSFDGEVWEVSPNGKYVAYESAIRPNKPKSDRLSYHAVEYETSLSIADVGGHVIHPPAALSIIPNSLRWSGSSDSLFAVAFSETTSASLVAIDPQTGSVKVASLDSCRPTHTLHSGIKIARDGTVLVECESTQAHGSYWSSARGILTGLPEEWLGGTATGALVGFDGESIWRYAARSNRLSELTPKHLSGARSIVHPSGRFEDASMLEKNGMTEVAFTESDRDSTILNRIDLNSGHVYSLGHIPRDASVIAYAPTTHQAIIRTQTRDGLTLSLVGPNRENETLMATNQFLAGIIEAPALPITYTGLDGTPLTGWILLPIDYQKGKRYPLITYVYPGTSYNESRPEDTALSFTSNIWLNLQIPAARGFAVLIPSMPLNAVGERDDPMLRLTNGVLPAVDAAIATGIANPSRLYLLGHSFGGFAVYGLVAQTDRFTAAVALSGLTDMVSLYGDIAGRFRYFDHLDGTEADMIESGQVNMGGPPYADFAKFIRNSPLFLTDRVHTPILMMHGDLDYVPIEQTEEFFSFLSRQGNRARFVRYWGEGHTLRSPANVADLWRRIFDWFADPATSSKLDSKPTS